MASAHIEIGVSTRLSTQLRTLIDQLQAIHDLTGETKLTFDQLALGGDYAALGAAIGVNATDAQTVYNLLGSVDTELNGTFIPQFLSRLG